MEFTLWTYLVLFKSIKSAIVSELVKLMFSRQVYPFIGCNYMTLYSYPPPLPHRLVLIYNVRVIVKKPSHYKSTAHFKSLE